MLWIITIYFIINVILTLILDFIIFNYKVNNKKIKNYDKNKFENQINYLKNNKVNYLKFLIFFLLFWQIILIYSFFKSNS